MKMSNFVWTVADGSNSNIHLELPLTPHIDDIMKDVLEDARFGEVASIVVKYSNGASRSFNCYPKEH
jgi:hypothetical protein